MARVDPDTAALRRVNRRLAVLARRARTSSDAQAPAASTWTAAIDERSSRDQASAPAPLGRPAQASRVGPAALLLPPSRGGAPRSAPGHPRHPRPAPWNRSSSRVPLPMEPSDRDELVRSLRPGLVGWLAFSVSAGLAQGLAPRAAARHSTWRHSAGWQREIALWNVGLSSALLRAILEPKEPAAITLAHSLRILSIALGLNHLVALRNQPRFVHLGGAGGNALAVAVLSRALHSARK